MSQIIQNLSEISMNYKAIFCDVWGVVHNGITPYPEAVEALMQARLQGAFVCLVTNSSRTSSKIREHLSAMGVPETAYDAISTAGEAMQHGLFATNYEKMYVIGKTHDGALFDDVPEGLSHNLREVDIDDAECIIIADIDDDARKQLSIYDIELRKAAERDLPLFCANPDIVADVGDERLWCAGAVAQRYEEFGGGQVFQFGKPHPPIYLLAQRKMFGALGRETSPSDILFIGDGIATDLKGAMQEDMDALFVSGGLAFEETATDRKASKPTPAPAKLDAFLKENNAYPQYSIGMLR